MEQLTETPGSDNQISVDLIDNNNEEELDFSISQLFKMLVMCCWPPVHIFPRLVSFCAFQAPNPPTYEFVSHKNKLKLALSPQSLAYIQYVLNQKFKSFIKSIRSLDVFFCLSKRGNRIAGYFIEAKYKTNLTIIFSHCNSTDLGLRSEFCWIISKNIDCNVIAYDYSGYGSSSGHPSEDNIYSDIECVFNYLNTKYNIHSETTLLYGESIGSVPTIDLGTKHKFLGIILESPILSGLRTLCGKCVDRVWPFDPFPNIIKVRSVECKVLIIHGTNDELVDITDAKLLYERCKYKVKPFWAQDYPHNTCSLHPQFYQRINQFIENDLQFKRFN